MKIKELQKQTEHKRAKRIRWDTLNNRKLEDMNQMAKECNFMALRVKEYVQEIIE